ncbi:MAG: hypothetical protein RL728_501 [Bacteroidota bacterium]|jgi:hypothetical protein
MRILELLKQAGCNPKNYGSYITCSAKYRGGNDPSSIAIYFNKNIVKDFVTGKVFSIEDFLKSTLDLKDTEQARSLLTSDGEYFNFAFNDTTPQDPFSSASKFYPHEYLSSLKDNHSYWKNRGISEETLKQFKGGLCLSGKMYNRYVFPIFDSRFKIRGFSGRDVSENPKIKWKHIGAKNEWAYPLIFNYNIIAEKREIILVESIGDMLSLWESGIKNTGVTFGTDLGKGLLKAIIRLDPNKIIIATNKDKNFAGQKASIKIKSKFKDFFDPNQLEIRLPFKNDFGEQSIDENIKWYEN